MKFSQILPRSKTPGVERALSGGAAGQAAGAPAQKHLAQAGPPGRRTLCAGEGLPLTLLPSHLSVIDDRVFTCMHISQNKVVGQFQVFELSGCFIKTPLMEH